MSTTATTTRVTIRTEPFTCPSCIKKIEGALGRLDGIHAVKVMFNSGKVKVAFDDSLITSAAIAGTIEDLGYPVTRIAA